MNARSHDNSRTATTVLYALEPRGLGTPFVEGLTSLARRLAEAHVVSVTRLVEQEITRPHRAAGFDITPASSCTEALNANTPGTGVFLARLVTLTGRESVAHTALGERAPALYWRRSMRSNRAWCPECLRDGAGYDQLLWSFKSYRVCVIHGRALRDTCARCGRGHRALQWKVRSTTCPCGASLGMELGGLREAGANEVVLRDLIGRLERGHGLSCAQVRSGTSAFVHASGNLVTAGRRAGLTHSGVRIVTQTGRVGPETLVALLRGADQSLDTYCAQRAVTRTPGRRPNHRGGHKPRVSLAYLEPALRALLAGPDDALPSLNAFRLRHGVDADSLRLQLPELTGELIERARRGRAARRVRTRQDLIARVCALARQTRVQNVGQLAKKLPGIGIRGGVLLDKGVRTAARAAIAERTKTTKEKAA